MFSTRPAAALVLLLVAAGAFAQDATTPAEYGRTSGGQLALAVKQPTQLSGSLGLTHSTLFGSKGYEGTLGGTIVPDRLWFFGSLQRNDALRFTPMLPQTGPTSAAFGKIDARLGDRQSLSGMTVKSDGISPLTMSIVPAWFGSVHYTGIISSNAFFTASVSQSAAH